MSCCRQITFHKQAGICLYLSFLTLPFSGVNSWCLRLVVYKNWKCITLTSHLLVVAISRKYQILLPATVTLNVNPFILWVHYLSFCGFYIVFTSYLVVWYVVRHVASSGWYWWLCNIYQRKFHLPLQSLVPYDTLHTFANIIVIWYSAQSSPPVALCPCPLQAGHCTVCSPVVHNQ